jgi:hypothetical protein
MKIVCRIGLAIWERVRRSTMLLPKAFLLERQDQPPPKSHS